MKRKVLSFLLTLLLVIASVTVMGCGTASGSPDDTSIGDSALPEIALELLKIRADKYVTQRCDVATPADCAAKRQYLRRLIDHFVNVSQGGPLVTDEMRSLARAAAVNYIVANSTTVTPELAGLLLDEIERLVRKKT